MTGYFAWVSVKIEKREKPRIVVIGAGLAGLTAAWKLAESFGDRVLLLEQEDFTGGMAHTFSEGDLSYDFGSHRIHPTFAPEAMSLFRELLGEDMVLRERRGRLRLNGRYMDYPPDLAGFVKALGFGAALRGGMSFLATRLGGRGDDGAALSYEECMTRRAGKVIYDLFYSPYAWKVYGIDPKTLSAHAAKTRVSLKKPLAIARDIVLRRKTEKKYFYYPRHGIGTIAQELERRFLNSAGELLTGAIVQTIGVGPERVRELIFRDQGRTVSLPVELLISTIPLNELAGLVAPLPPPPVKASAKALKWRAIRFLYLDVKRDFCCESETYYYPETRYAFGRISEPKRFSPHMIRAEGKTVLCVEVLCNVGDRFWKMQDGELLRHVKDDLQQVGLLASEREIDRIFSKRLPAVYPIYDLAWQDNFQTVYRFLDGLRNLYLIGRGGLFLHNNMDHSIVMGLKAADFIAANGDKTAEWTAGLADFRHFEVRD